MRTVLLFLPFLLFSELGFAKVLLGTARNAKGDIIYKETHKVKEDEFGFNKHIEVVYSTPTGQTFAKMTSDFAKNKFIPDTVFTDERFDMKYTLTLMGESVDFEKFEKGKMTSKKSVPLEKTMVASQGFDNFIRFYSSKLLEKPQKFQFGVLDRMEFFSLTGYKKPGELAGQLNFGIRVSSWLLRLFAKQLQVVYDAKTLRLIKFAGSSNILTDQGESQDVVITYEWNE